METPPSSNRPAFPKESIPGNRHALRHNQYEVDVYRLIDLIQEVPETTVSIGNFVEDLNDKSWTDDSGKNISPQEVIDAWRDAGGAEKMSVVHPEFSDHMRKIENADPSVPIIIFESKIIDGMHRFVKAVLEGRTDIRAKIISEIPNEAIIKIHDRKGRNR